MALTGRTIKPLRCIKMAITGPLNHCGASICQLKTYQLMKWQSKTEKEMSWIWQLLTYQSDISKKCHESGNQRQDPVKVAIQLSEESDWICQLMTGLTSCYVIKLAIFDNSSARELLMSLNWQLLTELTVVIKMSIFDSPTNQTIQLNAYLSSSVKNCQFRDYLCL